MIIELTTDGLNAVLREAQGVLNEALKMKKAKDKDKKICKAIGYLRSADLLHTCYEPIEEKPENLEQG